MSELIGRNLGQYRIIEPLGLGGMATVYKAYQPSMDRYVAIKVLPRHFAHDPTFIGRFEQEAKVIAKLEHARILPVFDYGEDDGTTYIVMRLLTAGTLADRLTAGPLPLADCVRIISQIAEGLDYAHRRGVIHRDIKPSNILLDDSGDAYLTDFGISKLVEGTAQFTGSGIVGTPAYLSPEQGLGQPIDHRADLYSLGVVLYQMATGQVPFVAETPMAVVIKHINDPLPLPRLANPALPERVEAVILKALAKDPNARYQTAGELARALQRAAAESGADVLPPLQEAETEEAAATAILRGAADTIPLTPVSEPTGELARKPAAPAEKPRRRIHPLLIAGIVLVLCVCGFLALAALNNARQQNAQATQTAQVAATLPADQTPLAEATATEGDLTATPSPAEPQIAAGGLPTCPNGTQFTNGTDFEQPIGDARLPRGTEVIALEDGRRVLNFAASVGDLETFFFEPTLASSVLVVKVSFPAAATHFGLGSRVHGEDLGYAAAFTADGEVTIQRNRQPVTARTAVPVNLFDGQTHIIELHTRDIAVEVVVDDTPVISFTDPEPLPAGVFAFGVYSGQAYLDAVAVCSPEGMVIFADEFESPDLLPVWRWVHEPGPGEWGIEGGALRLNTLPGTSLAAEPFAPALIMDAPNLSSYVVEVMLEFRPEQNFQGAGLVVFNRAQEPIFSLLRATCDESIAPYCRGDAIYFDYWPEFIRVRELYAPRVSGVGELPPEGRIRLRLVSERGVLRAAYSLDGTTWRNAGEWPSLELRIGGVGIATSSGGQPAGGIPALFDHFVIRESLPPAP